MEEYRSPSTRIPFQGGKEYHVFLSFRGEDVRKNLVDHLYEILTAAGLHVFLDSHKLEKGEIIGLSLEKAIQSSAIRIPIFSKGYAESVWCLREAAIMVNTQGLIIPLFYDVDPTHVRYPQGNSSPYKQAFQKHYSHSDQCQREVNEWWKYGLQRICPCLEFYGHSARYQREEIDGWKNALEKICSRSGWSMDITGGSEDQLVKRVASDVIKTFDRMPLEVGMESVTQDLIPKFILNSEEGVIKAGLWGIGGIGKTTLAKVMYNQVFGKFDAASFVFDVRATAADSMGLRKLQKQILEDLTNYDGNVQSVDEGISLFRDRLRGKRVLLILDDVEAKEQSDALVGDWLAPGSRVIITSRNKHIFHVAGVSSECIYEMTGLQINESLQLFSWHAFLRTYPTPTHDEMSKRVVEACKGHPLSLEVIGSFLYDKQNDPGYWMEAVNVTLNPDIHERLKISYNALRKEEKEIFLDIACFFIGEHKKCPIIFWKSLYRKVDRAISSLSQKLLIKIDDRGVFGMHDHLRDMGQTIAVKEGNRLWEKAYLSTASKNINFSRLRLDGGNWQRELIETMCRPGLQFLHLKNLLIDGITENTRAKLPPSLIWLRLQICEKPYPFSHVDNIRGLRIMQVDGDISKLQYSLSNILDNLIHLSHLELRNCTKLNNIPDSIGTLSNLQHLDLSGCSELNNLSDTIGNLFNLHYFDLQGCKNLNNLPVTIGNLSRLQHLDLQGCKNLNNLPVTIGNLSRLQHLDLSECETLNNLPCTIGNLSELQYLNLRKCKNLTSLPDTIGNLSQLQYLNLSWCTKLNYLPDTIGNSSLLEYMNVHI